MLVTIDTSAVMAVLLDEDVRPRLLKATRGVNLTAPSSLPWEVGNAVTALFKRGRLTRDQGIEVISSFLSVPIRLVPIDLGHAVSMAGEWGIYAYDAYVLAAAEQLRTPLLSLDEPQRRIAHALGLDLLEVPA